jgi:effector-binding domain-containing protein
MTYTVSFADLQPQPVAVVRGRVDLAGLPQFLESAFAEVAAAAAAQGVRLDGAPFGKYLPGDDGAWEVAAGFPVSEALRDSGRVTSEVLAAGRVAHTMHVGAYDKVGAAYEAVREYVVDNGHEPSDPPWECYLDGPDVPEPRTEVFMPCRLVRAHPAPADVPSAD